MNGSRWDQQDNASGIFDALNLDRGALYYCVWSQWTSYSYLHGADTGTRWLDSDTGLDELTREPEDPNNAFDGGFASYSGGSPGLEGVLREPRRRTARTSPGSGTTAPTG